LIVSDGQRERELLLVGTIVVGRDPACDVSEDGDALLSRRHTEFVAGPDGVIVRDLGSRNGTFVNGVRIAEGPIRAGDIVHIGHLRLRYVEGEEPAASGRSVSQSMTPAPAPSAVEDEEVTRILSRPQSRPAASPAPASPADDEKTVVTPRPGALAAAPAVAGGVPLTASDDEKTVFVTSGAGVRAAPADSRAPGPSPPKAVPARAVAALTSESGALQTFVSAQVFGVAAIAFLTAAAAVVLGRTELANEGAGASVFLKWFALPLAISVLAAFRAGRAINRRIANGLAADNEGGRRV
jgi:predicted component of type VI protein secretion system